MGTHSSLPSGLVTFMFTDIEGSTRLHQALGADYVSLIAEHDELLGGIIAAEGGMVVKSMGDGLFAAFPDAGAAVRAACAGQRAVSSRVWPGRAALRVRIGLHSGLAEPQGRDYVAIAVHQASRVMGAANGGQILASRATVDSAGLLGEIGCWSQLGAYRLKDFDEAVDLARLDPAGLPAVAASVRATPAVAHNVPDVRSAFVGRKRDLAELSRLVTQGRRLISVLGPGGVGKTRIAFEVTKASAPHFKDGAWMVFLANATRDAGEIEERCLRALGVPDRGDRTPRRVLVDSLRERHCLLVFDNCEQVVNEVAEVVREILGECPRLSVVTTSREPLRLSGELEWRLATLPVAGSGDDAIELFLDRALSRFPGLVLDRKLVAQVCEHVDGLPLAVELAAGRLRHMQLVDLVAGLEDRMRLLTSGDRDLDPRQRSVHSLVDWSYGLLSDPAQTLLPRLSVLRGATTLDAVRAVAGDLDGFPLDETLAELVDKSLIVFDPDSVRPYRMLVTIRDYSRSRLEHSDDSIPVRRRHAEWFSGIAGQIAAGCEGPEVLRWLDEADAAYDDLNAAMTFALDAGDVDLLASIAIPASRYFSMRGRMTEGRKWLDQTARVAPPGRVKAVATSALGQMACVQGDLVRAREMCERGLEEGLPVMSAPELDLARYHLGHVLAVTGDLDEAEAMLRLAAESESPRIKSDALNGLGACCFYRGDLAGAERLYQDAMKVAAAVGCVAGIAVPQMNLGEALVAQRRFDEAEHNLLAAEAMMQQVQRASLHLVHEYLCRLYDGRGDSELADLHLQRAIQAAGEIGDTATQERLRAEGRSQ